jgi:signal transduction histidine kinase
VTCTVRKVVPFGIFVQVGGDGAVDGFIRPREWSWSRREFRPDVRPGDTFAARVIGYREHDLELSRRLTLPDPFPEFRKSHRKGDYVRGQVQLIAPGDAGVLLELEEGVSGFVPRSEMPDFATRRTGFGLLEQDWLEGRILAFDGNRVIVSVKEHLRLRDREDRSQGGSQPLLRYHPSVGTVLEDLSLTLQIRELPEIHVDPLLRDLIRQVLVVEDNGEVSESLKLVLEILGFPCDLASSVAEARGLLRERDYDLVILDINLPAEKGLELLGDIPRRLRFLCVLTGAPASDWDDLHVLEAGRVTGVFQKPASIQTIFDHLVAWLTGGDGPQDDHGKATGFSADAFAPEELTHIQEGSAARRQKEIARILRSLKNETRASQAFVLSYRPGPLFEIVAGSFTELTREVQQDLAISPVRDVIERRQAVHIPDVARRKAWFRHLLRIRPMGSFAGVPLAHGDQAEYGLFLIGDRPDQLRNASPERLAKATLEIGRILAEERLDAVITDKQGLLLTGFLADSLLHEVKNAIQAVDGYGFVQAQIARNHPADFSALSPQEVVELKRSIMGIQSVTEQIKDLIVLFRNLASPSQVEEVDINSTVRRLLALVRPLAESSRVVVEEPDLDPGLPPVRMRPKVLEHVFLNLLINAIEQMEEAKVPRRLLRVSTEHRPGTEHPIVVTIADTGPGIHTLHRDRIFDLFFTTKSRGTGLGLYISRLFVEQLGGRLALEESHLLSGSRFRVGLPAEALDEDR